MDSCLATGLGWAFGFGFHGSASPTGTARGTNWKGTHNLAFVGSMEPNSWNTSANAMCLSLLQAHCSKIPQNFIMVPCFRQQVGFHLESTGHHESFLKTVHQTRVRIISCTSKSYHAPNNITRQNNIMRVILMGGEVQQINTSPHGRLHGPVSEAKNTLSLPSSPHVPSKAQEETGIIHSDHLECMHMCWTQKNSSHSHT